MLKIVSALLIILILLSFTAMVFAQIGDVPSSAGQSVVSPDSGVGDVASEEVHEGLTTSFRILAALIITIFISLMLWEIFYGKFEG